MASGSYKRRRLKKPRANGTRLVWDVVIPALPGKDGTRRRHAKGGFRTKEDAQAYAAKKFRERAQGSWRADATGTFLAFLRDWLGAQEAAGTRRLKTPRRSLARASSRG